MTLGKGDRFFTALLRSRNRLMSLEEIIAISGTAPGTIKRRTVHVWMGKLRRILNDYAIGDHIRSVRSMGYVFDYPDREEVGVETQAGDSRISPGELRVEAILPV